MTLAINQFNFPSFYQIKEIASVNEDIKQEWYRLIKKECPKNRIDITNEQLEQLSFSFLCQLYDEDQKLLTSISRVTSRRQNRSHSFKYNPQAPISFYVSIALVGIVLGVFSAFVNPYKYANNDVENDNAVDTQLSERLTEMRLNRVKAFES